MSYYYREQHAEDWSAFIKNIGERRWLLVFAGSEHSCWFRRQGARDYIRKLKKGNGNG